MTRPSSSITITRWAKRLGSTRQQSRQSANCLCLRPLLCCGVAQSHGPIAHTYAHSFGERRYNTQYYKYFCCVRARALLGLLFFPPAALFFLPYLCCPFVPVLPVCAVGAVRCVGAGCFWNIASPCSSLHCCYILSISLSFYCAHTMYISEYCCSGRQFSVFQVCTLFSPFFLLCSARLSLCM